jgi:glycosyltransferase involved in cell wall biosynthesis
MTLLPSVAIVVPIKDKHAVADACLSSILAAANAAPATLLMVVDHASADGTLDIARRVVGANRVLSVDGGYVGRVRNVGAAATESEWLLFIDGDCVIPLDFVTRLRHVIARTGCGSTGCEVGLPATPHWIERAWDSLTRVVHEGETRWMNSACFAVRRDHFVAIGGFDETRTSSEDVDISNRLREHGVQIWQALELAVEHHGNPQSMGAFYRRLRWHGEGAVEASGRLQHSPTVYLVILHALLLSASAIALLQFSVRGSARGVAAALLVLPWCVPGALLFRAWLRQRRVVAPLAGALLLQVAMVARIHGLLRGLRRAQRPTSASVRTPL